MSLLDTASLIVTPNAGKEGKLYSVVPSSGAGDLDVTRATTATRVNSDGLVELVPYNLLQYSEQFDNAIWTQANGNGGSVPILTPNYGISPNGTQTAYRIQLTRTSASSSYSYVYQANSVPSGGTYTFSVWLKSLSGTPLISLSYNGTNYTNIVTLTTEWQRYEFTTTALSTNLQAGFLLFQSLPTTSLTADFLAYGYQLVEGSVAKDYQKTETRLNIPRLDYTNGSCPSILVEPQRTNIALYSEKLVSGFAFSFTGGVFTVDENTNDTLDPFGNNNADKFTTTSNFNDSYTSTSGSGNLTLSIFAKKGTNDTIQLYHQNVTTGNLFATTFNLNTGTIVGSSGTVTPKIEEFKNGWYRCSISGADTLTNGNIFRVSTYTGTTYLFGWQLEQGSYATSYIPTTSASVTRNADVISKTGISSLIGTEFTVFLDAYETIGGASTRYFVLKGTGGTYANALLIEGNSSNQLVITLLNSSSSTVFGALSSPLTNGQRFKLAVTCKNNDFAVYVNGSQIATQTSGTVPTTSDLYLGYYTDYSDNYSEINTSALWKQRLTNSQLEQLTSL
jgi:hypothetical protein